MTEERKSSAAWAQEMGVLEDNIANLKSMLTDNLQITAQRDAAFGFITGFLQEAHRLVDMVPGLAGHRVDGPRNGTLMDAIGTVAPGWPEEHVDEAAMGIVLM